jgi:hypothetical protein
LRGHFWRDAVDENVGAKSNSVQGAMLNKYAIDEMSLKQVT